MSGCLLVPAFTPNAVVPVGSLHSRSESRLPLVAPILNCEPELYCLPHLPEEHHLVMNITMEYLHSARHSFLSVCLATFLLYDVHKNVAKPWRYSPQIMSWSKSCYETCSTGRISSSWQHRQSPPPLAPDVVR